MARGAGIIHHGTLIIYGLAVALLAIGVWENQAEVAKVVSAESAAIAATYRDAGSYPEPMRSRLRADLKSYTEYIIREAWPEQRRGKVPAGGVDAMDRFQEDLRAFEPTTEGQRALTRRPWRLQRADPGPTVEARLGRLGTARPHVGGDPGRRGRHARLVRQLMEH